VNEFLESDLVDHKLGGVPGWKAAFGARYNGNLIAVCVLSRPVARALDDGDTISISRFGSRPERPANTGSWLIARARDWARLEGYETMIAYSGVADNYGTLYNAAGFEIAAVTEADGESWQSREGRSQWEDYTRRRWEYDLWDQ
jgi:GNAT superfamily N-acetyltransferase